MANTESFKKGKKKAEETAKRSLIQTELAKRLGPNFGSEK